MIRITIFGGSTPGPETTTYHTSSLLFVLREACRKTVPDDPSEQTGTRLPRLDGGKLV